MKAHKLLMLMALVGLVFGLMTGCGGGSSDSTPPAGGGGTPTPPPLVGLDNEKVNQTATQLAETLGCEYSTVTTAQSKKFNVALSYKTAGAIKTVLERESVLKYIVDTSRSAKETQTITGDCGGTLLMETEEDASGIGGTIDLTFRKYCNSEAAGVATTLNGSLNIVLSQTSETSMTITASTGIPLNIKATNPNTSENMNATVELQGGEVVINMDTSENMTSIDLTASSIKLTDHISGETCTATNLVANINMVTQTTTFSATVICSGDTGSIDVSGTADATGQATINVTDENGKKGTLTSTDTEGVFDVSFDGAPLGKMDCSMVDVPEL